MPTMMERDAGLVRIDANGVLLEGNLVFPNVGRGLVVFAHGSGSSRFSSRNRAVAEVLRAAGHGTLLLDLLTRDEEAVDERTRHLRFDIGMLADRLVQTVSWLRGQNEGKGLSIGFFGASTGGGAALVAAAAIPNEIDAVVSRGGRPDLAGPALPYVKAPTLLIVGGNDGPVIGMNRQAYDQMQCERKLEIVPGASHLFEEPGTLERVAALARDWFTRYLAGRPR
jgi:putative phosphoribosyl transferase